MLGQEKIGTVCVLKEGLYYRFMCKCQLSGEVVYQIIVGSSLGETNLGVCVPIECGFGINTRVPIKTVGDPPFSFTVVPKHTEKRGEFVPIRADEPFVYLQKLDNAYCSMLDGTHTIWIAKEDEGA